MRVSGGDKLEGYLGEIAKNAKNGVLNVGFLQRAKYSDGTPVAMVAAIQDFGAPNRGIPPTGFFRAVPKEHASEWGGQFAKIFRASKWKTSEALKVMGFLIKRQVQDSIINTNSPALSPVTLLLRKWRVANPSLKVTGETVGKAARAVADGADTSGVSTKRLIDIGTEGGHMLASVDFEVKGS